MNRSYPKIRSRILSIERRLRPSAYPPPKDTNGIYAKIMQASYEGSEASQIFSAICGLCVGDALGVPTEFMSRSRLLRRPVKGMRGYGSGLQPPGTWSDDTSLTLALLDSLAGGLDYRDILERFLSWAEEGRYSAHGKAFGMGGATRAALTRFANGGEPLSCGGREEWDNGNGSLMRILPLAFFLRARFGPDFAEEAGAMELIHNVSSLTHAHKRSHIACGIYLSVVGELLKGNHDARKEGMKKAQKYYTDSEEYREEFWTHFSRLYSPSFFYYNPGEMRSSPYVVDTLEAALWCLDKRVSYEGCVLYAVNLGGDTDTVAAVTGGLAGLSYGVNDIPKGWLEVIGFDRLEYIWSLCVKLADSFAGGNTASSASPCEGKK